MEIRAKNKAFGLRMIMTVLCFLILIFSACKKDRFSRSGSPINPPDTVVSPPTFVASAGNDTTIFLPFNTYSLNGLGTLDPGSNITAAKWEFIAGPSPVSVFPSNGTEAHASGMFYEGIYEYQLTVYGKRNLISKDTVRVRVMRPDTTASVKEIIFKDLAWNFDWIMEIDIYDFLSKLPTNSHLKAIYIKRDLSTEWEEVIPSNPFFPDYTFHTWEYGHRNLVIIPSNDTTNDTPDIKIEYFEY